MATMNFNPLAYHKAIIDGNEADINANKPKSYESESICAVYDATEGTQYLKPADLFPPHIFEYYAKIFQVEVLGVDRNFHKSTYLAIQSEYGYMMAHCYAAARGVKDRLYCMFYPCKQHKPLSMTFRDTAQFTQGYALQLINDAEIGISEYAEILTIKGYHSKSGSTAYCAIWMTTPDGGLIGAGKAGGYGYDRLNGALMAALNSIGLAPCRDYGDFSTTALALAQYMQAKWYLNAKLNWLDGIHG